jgi:hypothetical protein
MGKDAKEGRKASATGSSIQCNAQTTDKLMAVLSSHKPRVEAVASPTAITADTIEFELLTRQLEISLFHRPV